MYACICSGWSWAVDYPCDYNFDRANSVCSADGFLIYCGDDNFIHEVECNPYCINYYGDPLVTGTCGYVDELGANNCQCIFPTPTCVHDPYCIDSLYLVRCNAEGTQDDYINCNEECILDGAAKGVCDGSDCLCG